MKIEWEDKLGSPRQANAPTRVSFAFFSKGCNLLMRQSALWRRTFDKDGETWAYIFVATDTSSVFRCLRARIDDHPSR